MTRVCQARACRADIASRQASAKWCSERCRARTRRAANLPAERARERVKQAARRAAHPQRLRDAVNTAGYGRLARVRRAICSGAPADWSLTWPRVLALWGDAPCAVCSGPLDFARTDHAAPELDHRRPLALLGGHVAEQDGARQVQIVHARCNAIKGAAFDPAAPSGCPPERVAAAVAAMARLDGAAA